MALSRCSFFRGPTRDSNAHEATDGTHAFPFNPIAVIRECIALRRSNYVLNCFTQMGKDGRNTHNSPVAQKNFKLPGAFLSNTANFGGSSIEEVKNQYG